MDKENILIAIVVIVVIFILWKFYNREGFDEAGIAVTRYGDVKYDLKGDITNVRNVTNCYYDKRFCYDDTFGNTEHNSYGGKNLGRH
jgi:hypothetical protein